MNKMVNRNRFGKRVGPRTKILVDNSSSASTGVVRNSATPNVVFMHLSDTAKSAFGNSSNAAEVAFKNLSCAGNCLAGPAFDGPKFQVCISNLPVPVFVLSDALLKVSR